MKTPQALALQDRPTILLIEDEPTRCGLLTEALQEEGFAVAQAGDVHDALRQARDSRPDLIVVDPPPASVTRVLDRLRSDPATRGLPLIVIRRAGVPLDSGRLYAWPSSPVDVDLVLEHVWRVVNTRVLGLLNGHGRGDPARLVRDRPETALVGDMLRSVEVPHSHTPV
jgi:CheY-like chemotaxis protein